MKSIWMLFATLILATLPAVAQHHSNGGGHANTGGHETHGVQQRGNGERPNAGVRQRGNGERTEHHDVAGAPHAGYHYSGGGARGHFVGGRYDHEFFQSRWGADHRFFFGHCNWWGPRFGIGSYFWYDGGYWVIVDEIPYDWYDDEVYVDYVDGYGYALINPIYPGIRYHVGVRF